MKLIRFSEARANLSSVFDQVENDAEETVIATVTPPSKAEAPETVEEETEVVGEGEEAAEDADDDAESSDE